MKQLKKNLLKILAVVCLIIGAVGIALPILPGIPFILLGGYLINNLEQPDLKKKVKQKWMK